MNIEAILNSMAVVFGFVAANSSSSLVIRAYLAIYLQASARVRARIASNSAGSRGPPLGLPDWPGFQGGAKRFTALSW